MTDPQQDHNPDTEAAQQDTPTPVAGSDKPRRGGIFTRTVRALAGPAHGRDDDGASWGKVHNAVGAADFALDPAPGVAGEDRREGTPDQEVVTEGGHDQKQIPALSAEPLPSSDAERADHAVGVVREAPTVTAAEFVHHGVPVLDRPALPVDERAVPLAERMYRPRSGTNRTLQLTCSVEPAERDVIDIAAAKLHRSRSAFLADSAMSVAQALIATDNPDAFVPMPNREAVARLTAAFGTHQRALDRIGNNLNQLMVEVYRGQIPEQTLAVLDAIDSCATDARHTYQRVLPGGRRGA